MATKTCSMRNCCSCKKYEQCVKSVGVEFMQMLIASFDEFGNQRYVQDAG